jgi:ABC-type siderophore export system fused ATPase/permease subunit
MFGMSLVTKSQVRYVSIYGGSSVWGSGWWFSILLLWRRIDMAYFIAIVLMFLKVFLMVGIGILNFFSSDFIDGMCVVALAPAVIMIRGSTFHPLAAILSINGMHLLFFASIVFGENLSLQYVNAMNCMMRLGSMLVGGHFGMVIL